MQASEPRSSDSPADPLGAGSVATYRSGDVIGAKYRLDRLIGEGGMGSVWAARNVALEIDVAIKLIRRDFTSKGAEGRLVQEARAAARLGHPSIVRVFDFGQSELGDPFIVMELLDGETLGAMIDRKGRLAALTAVRMILPVASALAAAHAKGIVHRDMKPDNVVVVVDDAGVVTPKIVDFGLVKVPQREPVDGRITQAGAVMGSPDYMSPEQARGQEDLDERTDVWALSVMLYEMIAGRRPFHGENYNALISAVLLEQPTPTPELGAGDRALWDILARGLSKDAAARWRTAREMGEALAAWAVAAGATDDVAGGALRSHWLGRARASTPRDARSRIDEGVDRGDRDPAADLATTGSRVTTIPRAPVSTGAVSAPVVEVDSAPAPRRPRGVLFGAFGLAGVGMALAYTLVFGQAPHAEAAPPAPVAAAAPPVAAPAEVPVEAPPPVASATASAETAPAPVASAPKAQRVRPLAKRGRPAAQRGAMPVPLTPNF